MGERLTASVGLGAVEAVVFDAVGTLIRPEPAAAAAYHRAAQRYGSRLAGGEIARRFKAAFARQESLDAAGGAWRTDEQRERARWQAIVAEVLDDVAEQAELFADLWRHFAEPAHWSLYGDVPAAWQALSASGVQLAVASNFDARLQPVWQELHPAAVGSPLFVSSQLGYRKPGRAFFEKIQRELGVLPERILMVGDDEANDYHAARSAGWQALLLARDEETDPGDGIRRIGSLDQVAQRERRGQK